MFRLYEAIIWALLKNRSISNFYSYSWDPKCLQSEILLYTGTFVDLQLDAQNSYLFIYNTLTKILYTFRALPCSSSGGLRRNCIYMQPLVLSLSAGDCPVHQLRKNSFLTDNTRVCIYTITTYTS